MFGNHGLCGLLEEGAHGKSPKCLGGNLGDFGEFCKGLRLKKPNCTQKLDIPSKHTGAVFMTKFTLQITNRIPLFIQLRKANWWDNTQMGGFFAVLNEMLLPFRRIDGGRI